MESKRVGDKRITAEHDALRPTDQPAGMTDQQVPEIIIRRGGTKPTPEHDTAPNPHSSSQSGRTPHLRGGRDALARERMHLNPRGKDAAHRDLREFAAMVGETGLPIICDRVGLVKRQVNRMLSGAQPNPINRLLLFVEAAELAAARRAMDYVCAELGGRFIPIGADARDEHGISAIERCLAAMKREERAGNNASTAVHASILDAATIESAINALLLLRDRVH